MSDFTNMFEFLPGRLYYCAVTSTPTAHPQRHYFTIDHERTMQYWNFFLDFGPLNLGQLYRFCCMLNQKLSLPKYRDKVIVFYSSSHPHRRTNAAFLISAWSMLCLNRSPEEAFLPFKSVVNTFPPWHDATQGICSFNLTIIDTLKGLQKARECNFFNFDHFPIEEFEHYEKVENGDLSWLLNDKFIAFAGPHAASVVENTNGYQHLTPEHYVPYFLHRNVTLVVRLNKKYYDSRSFTDHHINHVDLYFLDGSNPPDHILTKFLQLCEETPGAVAVHCKAGLGRTGSCIGCYMMKHYRFTAEECIGWLRIARPGCIIGPQQQWMKFIQARMWHEGEVFRAKFKSLGPPKIQRSTSSNDNDDDDDTYKKESSRKEEIQRKISEDREPVVSISTKMAILSLAGEDGQIPLSARGTARKSARGEKKSARGGLGTARGDTTARSKKTPRQSPRDPTATTMSSMKGLNTTNMNSNTGVYYKEDEGVSQGDYLVARRLLAQQQGGNADSYTDDIHINDGNTFHTTTNTSNSQHNSGNFNGNMNNHNSITPRSKSAPNVKSAMSNTGTTTNNNNNNSNNTSLLSSGLSLNTSFNQKSMNQQAGGPASPGSPDSRTSSNNSPIQQTPNSKGRFRSFLSSTFRM